MLSPREIVKSYNVVFVGPVKNCGKYLPQVLDNIKRIGSLFNSYSCVFVENNSTDNSLEILKSFSENTDNVTILSLGDLDSKVFSRTCRIAIARNVGVEFCENSGIFDTHQYYISINMDNTNAEIMLEEDFLSCFKYDVNTWEVMTANQTNYFDIWCLRCDNWVVDDCWDRIRNKPPYMSIEEAHKIHVRSKFLKIPKSYGLIEVDAAYGGFGIYKSDFVKGSRHRGTNADFTAEECDLVNFCYDIKQKGGRIFINSELINVHSDFNEHDVPFFG